LSALGYLAGRYIQYQREKWHGRGTPLSESLRKRFSEYFTAEDLDRVRIVEHARLPIPNPPGYGQLLKLSRFALPDPAQVAAITFDDVVVASGEIWESLLFHEMVHVTQFRLLGVRLFAEQYMRGFVTTRSYQGIPLEVCAFTLQDRFLRCDGPLDVAAEVRRWLDLS
jgi:hypothetical protein